MLNIMKHFPKSFTSLERPTMENNEKTMQKYYAINKSSNQKRRMGKPSKRIEEE